MSTSGRRAAGGAAGPKEQSQRTAAPILLCSVVGRVALAGSHEALSALSNSHRVVCRNGTERPNYHSGPPDRIIQLYHYRRGTPIPKEARIIQQRILLSLHPPRARRSSHAVSGPGFIVAAELLALLLECSVGRVAMAH